MTPWRFNWLGEPAGFARPQALWLVLAAVALGVWAIGVALRRPKRVAQYIHPALGPLVLDGTATKRPLVRASLHLGAAVAFAISLAQPQCMSHTELSKRKGLDIVVALDASKSMLARDVKPSRLDRAKLELGTLLDELKGDRIAIVAFAGDAFVQCPLTSDYSAAKLFLKAIDPRHMPQGGTNIGAALAAARGIFEATERGAKEKIVVLISDGEDLSGEIQSEASALSAMGVRLYAVGIGNTLGEPIPELDDHGEIAGYKLDESGATVVSKLNREGLEALARDVNGTYFEQPEGVAIGEVIRVIDHLQKDELEGRLTVKYAEVFQIPLGVGLLLLLLAKLIPPANVRPA